MNTLRIPSPLVALAVLSRPAETATPPTYSVTDWALWLTTALTSLYLMSARRPAKGDNEASTLSRKPSRLGFACPDRRTGSRRRAASRRATDCCGLHGDHSHSRGRRSKDFRHRRAGR